MRLRRRLSFASAARNVASLAVAVALVGCSGSGGPAGASGPAAVQHLTSDGGAYRVDVATDSGGAPARGENTIVLTITDAKSGAPATGLTVTMVPFMPAMAHGASITPTVTESSGARYVATQVDLFMPGLWELRTTIAGATTDHVDPQFQIE